MKNFLLILLIWVGLSSFEKPTKICWYEVITVTNDTLNNSYSGIFVYTKKETLEIKHKDGVIITAKKVGKLAYEYNGMMYYLFEGDKEVILFQRENPENRIILSNKFCM